MTLFPADKARKGRQLWFALISVAMGGLILLGYVLWSVYNETWKEAESTARIYAEVFEVRLDTALRRVDADLQAIVAQVPVDALERHNVPAFREQIEQELNRHQVAFPEVAGFRIVDANGDLFYLTGGGVFWPDPTRRGTRCPSAY